MYVLCAVLSLDRSEIDHKCHYKYLVVVLIQDDDSADAFGLIYGQHACLFSSFVKFLALAAFLPQEGFISNSLNGSFDKRFQPALNKCLLIRKQE